MSKTKLTLLALLITIATSVSAQITGNVTSRVFFIQARTKTGTAFAIEVDGRQYLVTAKHVVTEIEDEEVIQISKDGIWVPLNVKVFRCDDPIDIAVLVPPRQISNAGPIPTKGDMWFPGQEMFFLGFPYGMQTDLRLPGGYPIALAKKAMLSGMTPLVPGKTGMLYILDGYNNPGFSGAPLVFRDTKTGLFVIAAVVVSFKPEAGPVLNTVETPAARVTADDLKNERILTHEGKYYRITKETTDMVKLNTGIAFAHDLEFAEALIRDNKLEGPKVSPDFKP